MQEKANCGFVISITGPTACGRSKLMSGILQRFPNFDAAMQVTTRARRTVDDPSMACVSQSEFDRRSEAGEFFDPPTHAYGYSYAIEKKGLLASLGAGRDVVMIGHSAIFPDVARSLPAGFRALSHSIFLSPIPIAAGRQGLTGEELDLFTTEVVNRLIERRSDQLRIAKAKELIPTRIAKWLRSDYIIANPGKEDGIEKALEAFAHIYAGLQSVRNRPAPSAVVSPLGIAGLLMLQVMPSLLLSGIC